MPDERDIIERLEAAMAAGTPVDEAIRRAGQRAFQYHAWTRTKLWIWRDGRVEALDPNDPDAVLPEGFVRPEPGPPPWIGL